MPARLPVFACLSAFLIFSIFVSAQDRQYAPPERPLDFQQAVRQAGSIFDGVVVAVAPERDTRQRPTAVRVTFRVHRAMRGLPATDTVTVREWAGLWTLGPRYRVGERVVLLLYPPSRAGLTSPVGGDLGRMKVDRAGRVTVPPGWRDARQVTEIRTGRKPGSPLAIKEFADAVRRAEEE